jgi:hypothetical protein
VRTHLTHKIVNVLTSGAGMSSLQPLAMRTFGLYIAQVRFRCHR